MRLISLTKREDIYMIKGRGTVSSSFGAASRRALSAEGRRLQERSRRRDEDYNRNSKNGPFFGAKRESGREQGPGPIKPQEST